MGYYQTSGLCIYWRLFPEFVEIAVNENHFAVGSPLGPTLANIVLNVLEERFLENCRPEFKPLLYRRCVHDTNWPFKNMEKMHCFLDYTDKQQLQYQIHLLNRIIVCLSGCFHVP